MPSPSSMSNEEPTKDLANFFQTIWGDAQGYVYLPTLDRDSKQWRRVFFEWPQHQANIINHVLAASAKGLESYYSPAIYKAATTPTKDNVLGASVLWVEFDGEAPSQWGPSESAPEAGEAVSGAGRAYSGPIPAPTVRVQSSKDGHEHVYWKLDEFTTDIQWIEDKNRSITYTVRSDTSGWDIVQILRPPHTTNMKRDLPVTVIENNDRRYANEKFSFLKPPAQLVQETIEVGDLPAVDLIIAKYPWDETHFKLFADSNVPEGNRSDALMRLGYFCAEIGMTDTEAYAVLLHADERWGKYKGRADRKRRLVDIINRARVKHPNPLSELTFSGLLAGESVEEGHPAFYGMKDFLASEVHIEWVIEGLLEKGGFGIVASMPGVGKTQWSIQLAISAALGIPFLGWEIVKPQKVVLLSLEMSHVALKIFMQTIARHYTEEQMDLLQENLIIVPFGSPLSLDKPEGFQYLTTLLDEIQPEGLVIDSIGKLTMEDLNEKMAKTLNTRYLALRERYGCFIWLIHHNRKATDNNKKPSNLSDIYGNVYITAEMTSCMVLWPDEKSGQIEVIPVKMRLSEMRKPFYMTRDANLHFEESNPPMNLVTSALAEEANNGKSVFNNNLLGG